MDVKKVAARAGKTFAIDYGEGDVLTVTVNNGALSLAEIRRLQAQAGDERQFDVAAWLARIVTSWDLTDNGETVPIDADSIVNIPMAVLEPILDTVAKSITVPK